MPLAIGQSVAGYTIVRLLGSGGMGEVYLAQHPRLPRQDALKVLQANAALDGDFRERFIREADLAASLTHPNIVPVYDRGDFEGQLWIASQYIAGTDAAHLLADGYPDGMPPEMVSDIVRGIASALDFANDRGLLHRDVKPANILLSEPDGNGKRHVYLADFGIARSLAEPNGLTATNMTLGTFAYSAPEQLLGDAVDERADQYSLAATAYHLLSGSQLYPSSNVAAVINQQLNTPPPDLANTRPELARLDPILHVALSKRAEDRFQRCSDFAAALAEQIGTTSEVGPSDPTMAAAAWKNNSDSPVTPSAARTDRRWRGSRLVIAAAAVAAVLIGGAIIAWRPWQHSPADSAGISATVARPGGVAVSTDSGSGSGPSGNVSARSAADAIRAAVPEVTEIIDVNEENDPNQLLGRPNGYIAGAVLMDSRAACTPPDNLGVDCGAVIEQFPDAAAARRRADYVQQITAAMPMAGHQWVVLNGDLVLRVSDKIKPSEVKAYESAFKALQ